MAYGCVFLIIFIETGVVFFPFLPGDSLLFASGFFAHNGGFNIVALLAVAWAAAILGDQCNFMIGHFFGKDYRLGQGEGHDARAHQKVRGLLGQVGSPGHLPGSLLPVYPHLCALYRRHGRHALAQLFIFNVLGGITWSTVFTLLGYFFGGIPFVQEHFELLIIGIVAVSIIPTVVGLVKAKLGKKNA